MVDKNIYIVQGEINAVVGAIKRNARWSTHTHLVSCLGLLLPICAVAETAWFREVFFCLFSFFFLIVACSFMASFWLLQ